jgi:hypothetical protein
MMVLGPVIPLSTALFASPKVPASAGARRAIFFRFAFLFLDSTQTTPFSSSVSSLK